DLKENGGYHAAKDEQGKIEARILQLKQLQRTATVGEAPAADGTVSPGTLVSAKIAGEMSLFQLGNRENAADAEDLDVSPESSPIGQAIIGRKAGEKLSYTAPNGREIPVEIVKVEAYQG